MELSYEIPSAGTRAINSDKLLDNDGRYVRQFLECTNISVKSLKDDLKHLEDWYARQHHLPDDKWIKQLLFQNLFLTGSSVEKTKVKVDNYYSLRNKFPEIFKKRDPCAPEIDRDLRSQLLICLPKRTTEHHRIVMARVKGPTTLNPLDIVKMAFMIVEYRFCNEVELGEHWVVDCRHISLANVMVLASIIPKAIYIWIKGYATRVKGIHLVHVPSYGEPLVKLSLKLAKKKIVDRFHTYSDFEELFKVFPKSMFPIDYGGDEQSCEQISEAWADTLQSPAWRDWFLAQDEVCADESKRFGPSNIDDDIMFGVEGSFKELAID